MCGRYSLFAPQEAIEERLGATFAGAFRPRYNAAPSQSLPVVTDDEPETIERKEWGFVPPWADDRESFGFINARAETIAEKPTFEEAFGGEDTVDGLRVGRCLVPADGFYEWVETESGTQPYRVALDDDRPFAMAGLWAQWRPPSMQTGLDAFAGDADGDADRSGREVVETFTVVTTEPNDLVEDLHHRMAAILRPGEDSRWLHGDEETARDVLRPYPSDEMRSYPVSSAVGDPSNDSPAFVEQVERSG